MKTARYRTAERQLWQSRGLTAIERWIDLEHIGCSVRVQECGEGPPVLFVHGATNAGTSWIDLVAGLRDFHCILLDRPGCGLSAPLPARLGDIRSFERYGDSLVVDVLDALALDSAHVVATSYGGYLMFRGAAAEPDRFDSLVEIGWPFGAPMARTPLVMRAGATPGLRRLMAAARPNRRAVRSMLRQIGLRGAVDSGRFSDESIDWYLALLRDTDTMRNELDSVPRVIRPVRGMDRRLLLDSALLGSFRSPVGVIWGQDDPFGGAQTAEDFVARLPSAELELRPGAGHAPWVDEPEVAAELTRRFLRR